MNALKKWIGSRGGTNILNASKPFFEVDIQLMPNAPSRIPLSVSRRDSRLHQQIGIGDPVLLKDCRGLGLRECTRGTCSKLPMLELELASNRGADFSPRLGHAESGKGVSDMVDSIVGSFLQISTLFKRLNTEGTYMREMHSDPAVSGCASLLSEMVEYNTEQCLELKETVRSLFLSLDHRFANVLCRILPGRRHHDGERHAAVGPSKV